MTPALCATGATLGNGLAVGASRASDTPAVVTPCACDVMGTLDETVVLIGPTDAMDAAGAGAREAAGGMDATGRAAATGAGAEAGADTKDAAGRAADTGAGADGRVANVSTGLVACCCGMADPCVSLIHATPEAEGATLDEVINGFCSNVAGATLEDVINGFCSVMVRAGRSTTRPNGMSCELRLRSSTEAMLI